MSDTTTPPGPPTFLTIPLHIRKEIYSYILKLPEPIYIFQDRGSNSPISVSSFTPSRSRPRNWTAILRTNSQIHTEAREILYAENQFVIEEVRTQRYSSRVFEAFLDRIGQLNAGVLRDLTVTFPGVWRGVDGGWRVGEEGVCVLQRVRGSV